MFPQSRHFFIHQLKHHQHSYLHLQPPLQPQTTFKPQPTPPPTNLQHALRSRVRSPSSSAFSSHLLTSPSDPYDLSAPPRNVLSEETVARALAAADQGLSSIPKPSTVRRESSKSSKSKHSSSSTPSYENSSYAGDHPKSCDCRDCYAKSDKRGAQSSSRKDKKTGDIVTEYDGAPGGSRIHVHEPEDFVKPAAPRRSETANSTRSSKSNRSESGPIYVGRNRDGDEVQEWSGAEAPPLGVKYDWDAAENQHSFPDLPQGALSRRQTYM